MNEMNSQPKPECVRESIFSSNEYGGLWWEEEIAEPTVENK